MQIRAALFFIFATLSVGIAWADHQTGSALYVQVWDGHSNQAELVRSPEGESTWQLLCDPKDYRLVLPEALLDPYEVDTSGTIVTDGREVVCSTDSLMQSPSH